MLKAYCKEKSAEVDYVVFDNTPTSIAYISQLVARTELHLQSGLKKKNPEKAVVSWVSTTADLEIAHESGDLKVLKGQYVIYYKSKRIVVCSKRYFEEYYKRIQRED